MAPSPTNSAFIQQLDGLVNEISQLQARSRHDDCTDVMPESKAYEIATRAYTAIERVSGKASLYTCRADMIMESGAYEQLKVMRILGVLRSLSADLMAGHLQSLEELIHGAVFADFLEMAQHLLESGYKDAAAVIAGSTLESHLRQLCGKHSIKTSEGASPKKADTLNTDLAKGGVYSKLDQKNVTAWLGLRNDAAHGNYTGYDKNQVVLLVSSVRDFITRNPA